MKTVTRFAVVLGILLMPGVMFAQDAAEQPAATIPASEQPTKDQLAKLFHVMRLREQMESVMKMMPTLVQKQVEEQAQAMAEKQSGGALTDDQQKALGEVMRKYMEKAMNVYTVDEMIDDMSSIYQRHLSSADVDAFIAFYSSSAGQHLLDAQPAIMQEYMPLVMNRTAERSKELTDELASELKNLPQFTAPKGDKPADSK